MLQNIFRLGQQNSSPDATLVFRSTTKIGFASRETYGTTKGEHEVMFDSCESVGATHRKRQHTNKDTDVCGYGMAFLGTYTAFTYKDVENA